MQRSTICHANLRVERAPELRRAAAIGAAQCRTLGISISVVGGDKAASMIFGDSGCTVSGALGGLRMPGGADCIAAGASVTSGTGALVFEPIRIVNQDSALPP